MPSYPGRRYYSGTVMIDDGKAQAIERAKEISVLNCNVQPPPGSQEASCAACGLD